MNIYHLQENNGVKVLLKNDVPAACPFKMGLGVMQNSPLGPQPAFVNQQCQSNCPHFQEHHNTDQKETIVFLTCGCKEIVIQITNIKDNEPKDGKLTLL